MGFSFRRSASFGPFRLNFSQSGVGASVGVKGARVTLTPRGRTYITVGAGGFSYRQNLSMQARPGVPNPPVQAPDPPTPDRIETADVEQLRASSKSELVDDLNRRARMFNPAIIVFCLAALGALTGVVELGGSAANLLPALPNASAEAGADRQSNTVDEYAQLLARYGQPSAVQLSQVGTVPVRMATWNAAHTSVQFVPAGCVDAFRFFQAKIGQPSAAADPQRGRHRSHSITTEPAAPACNTGNLASTIVSYQDSQSHGPIDSMVAGTFLGNVSVRSAEVPTPTVLQSAPLKGRPSKRVPVTPKIEYDSTAFEGERRRLNSGEASDKQDFRLGLLFLSGALVLLVPGVWLHRKNKEKRTTELLYDIEGAAKAQHEEMEGALDQLSRSHAIWRLDSQSIVTDWKRNAGAAYNVQRERVAMRRGAPTRVESNIKPLYLDLGKTKLFFLPDQVLYWQRGTFASLDYADLKMTSGATRFIEDSVQTSDSQQVGTTWRYVRKDGGPDRRFNNNRQLPIMLYGVLHATSSAGLNLIFHTSVSDAASTFQTMFQTFQVKRAKLILPCNVGSDTSETPRTSHVYSDATAKAWTVLGVKPGASSAEVLAAYRHMAQMYHPDKTSGLGPELRELADQRMKEINAAHQVLKEHQGHA